MDVTPPPSSGRHGPRPLKTCTGDDCPCKQGESVHPPVLMAFDPDRGEYVRAEARCTARWTQSQCGHIAGQMCGQEATHQVGDTWVCDHHYQRARKWAKEMPKRDYSADVARLNMFFEERMRLDRERAKQQAALRREAAKLECELAREQILAEDAARAELSIVYYLQRADGLIKIGTSRQFGDRLMTLKREHGDLILLASHGGAHKEENAVHVQFKTLRVEGEWFRADLLLIEHIQKVRKAAAKSERTDLPVCVNVRTFNRLLYAARGVAREAESAA